MLNRSRYTIEYKTDRTKAGRWVELTTLSLPDDAAGDGGDDGDGVSTTAPSDTLPSPIPSEPG